MYKRHIFIIVLFILATSSLLINRCGTKLPPEQCTGRNSKIMLIALDLNSKT